MKNNKHQRTTALRFLFLFVWITALFVLSGCAFLEEDSLRRKGGGGGQRAKAVLWVNLALFSWSCVAQRDMLFCGQGCVIFFFRAGHNRTEETLVALKKSQINNLGPNDSQVLAGRTAICGEAFGGTPPAAPVAQSTVRPRLCNDFSCW